MIQELVFLSYVLTYTVMAKRKKIKLDADGHDYKYFRSHVRKLPNQMDMQETVLLVAKRHDNLDTWEQDLLESMVSDIQTGEFDLKNFYAELPKHGTSLSELYFAHV